MPTHTYLRYSQDAAWGVICSGGGQVAVDTTGKLALAPALEAVAVWNVKTGALVQALRASTATPSEVTALELGSDGDTLAVGHADGSIRLWQLAEGNERLTLNGHKGAVNALRLNRSATLLVSGGRDTALVLWDVIAERGICRLRGHRDAVTDMCLLEAHHALASVSKDGTLRLWDLHTQHCVQNVTVPSGEAWSVDCDASCERLLTGGAKAELLAWRIETRQLAAEQPAAPTIAIATTAAASGGGGESGGESGGSARAGEWRGVHAVQLGPLGVRASVSRVVRLRFGLDDAVVAVQFADRNLVLYSVQSSAQLKRQLKRRQAKRRKQLDGTDGPPLDDGGTDAASSLSAADSYLPLCHLRGAHKLHSFAFLPRQKAAAAAAAAVGDGGDGASSSRKEALTARLLIADRSNTLAVHACELRQGGTTSVVGSVSLCGHRAEPRSIALSTDDRTLLSASDGEAKVWNVKSQQCTGTLGCGYGLSVVFLLASKYAVVGTKAGLLQVFSLASTEMVAEVEAHAGAIWSLAVQPGTTTLLSASADKTLATWTPLEAGPTQISLGEEMRHEAGDDVLCARYTPNAKQVVAALLDGSIQVLFSDSFSLALTLYGHKLPALCVSVASDNAIAVSGSADKTIKIWGLDFGDCHRSLYGHSESVMSVAFVRETHYFFSSSKDHTIRYWDADRFEHILTMRGHHAEVWCIVPARTGAFLASASKDRSLRVWRRGDEQVFVEEEREAELEQVSARKSERGGAPRATAAALPCATAAALPRATAAALPRPRALALTATGGGRGATSAALCTAPLSDSAALTAPAPSVYRVDRRRSGRGCSSVRLV